MLPAEKSRLYTQRQLLARWLVERLSLGKVEALLLLSEAQITGHSRSTLMRAKKDAGVVSERQGMGVGAVWYWQLPEQRNDI